MREERAELPTGPAANGAGPRTALEISGLTKDFGRIRALDGVDLTIRPGEIFALLGPNGAGKTTLISIVAGVVRASSGSVKVFGHDLKREPMKVRASIGLVPQETNYDPFFNVNEVLRFMMGYFGLRPDQARIDAILEAFGLMDKKHSNTRALSGGMKRRLLIAKALIHDPPLVFLDEPTAGVDVELREELWKYIRRLRERGTTIVLTTHYIHEAERLADRIGILSQGRLIRIGARDDLLREFGEQVLVFELARPIRDVPPPLAELGVEPDDGGKRLIYRYRTGNGRLDELIDSIRDSGLSVQGIQDRHTQLEEVFLKILGREGGWL
ncbi:MAG: ABC transporter ATP-binding protein [bacterium]